VTVGAGQELRGPPKEFDLVREEAVKGRRKPRPGTRDRPALDEPLAEMSPAIMGTASRRGGWLGCALLGVQSGGQFRSDQQLYLETGTSRTGDE
jgi:hypothetical protein